MAETNPQYFVWSDANPEKLRKVESGQDPKALQVLNRKYRSMMGLLDYFYEFELQFAKKESQDNANTRR